MSVSTTDVTNTALALLNQGRVVGVGDAGEAFVLSDLLFEETRDELLGRYKWRFAIKRQSLSDTGEKPLFEWNKKFNLPADYVSFPEIWGNADFSVEGLFLYANTSEVLLRYVSKVTDSTKWSPLFVRALAGDLAYKMALRLTGSRELRADMLAFFEDAIRRAQFIGSIEETARKIDVDDLGQWHV